MKFLGIMQGKGGEICYGCMKQGSGRARTDTDGIVMAADWHGLTRTDTDGLPITVNYSGNNLVYYLVKIGLAQETITV